MDDFLPKTRLSRRVVLRRVAGGAAALGASVVLNQRAVDAGRMWCQTDPEFLVNGRRLHVYLLGEEFLHDAVSGPTQVTLRLPREVADARFVWSDDGFGRHGYDVRIEAVDWLDVTPNGAIRFEVETVVPAEGDHAIVVEAVHEHWNGTKTKKDRRNGRTNRTVIVTGKL